MAKREHLIRGRVRAFKQKSRKTVKKVLYATVRYGTLRSRSVDKFGAPSVLLLHATLRARFTEIRKNNDKNRNK
jgi:hypothetical protein